MWEMTVSSIWSVDRIAAANLCRALGIDPNDERVAIASEHLADHRSDAFKLAVSRFAPKIHGKIHDLLMSNSHFRDAHWSDGCRAAEQAIISITASDLSGMRDTPPLTKGRALRAMIRATRQRTG